MNDKKTGSRQDRNLKLKKRPEREIDPKALEQVSGASSSGINSSRYCSFR
jgi:hypothetical protein